VQMVRELVDDMRAADGAWFTHGAELARYALSDAAGSGTRGPAPVTSRSLTTLAGGRSFRVIETPERRTAAYRAEGERRRTQDCVQLGANRHSKGLDAWLAP